MGEVTVPGGSLAWSLLDLTPPWIETPETIVMHHGIGANRNIFSGWLPVLIGRYRILLFDMRGHGGSSRAGIGTRLTVDCLTDDLFAVMNEAGVPRAHLVGESIGGTIALNAALRVPERVKTLTVSNGAHVGASIQSVADWQRIIDTQGMKGWSAHMMSARFHPGALTEPERRWFETQQASVCSNTVLALLEALVGADLVRRLPSLQPPLLLLHPDGSPFIPVPVMADFHQRVPGARLHIIGHAKHGLPFSHSEQCAGLVCDFLGEQAV